MKEMRLLSSCMCSGPLLQYMAHYKGILPTELEFLYLLKWITLFKLNCWALPAVARRI